MKGNSETPRPLSKNKLAQLNSPVIVFMVDNQVLIQKEKVHINCEEGAQISILPNKIATQWWPNIIIKGILMQIWKFANIFVLTEK